MFKLTRTLDNIRINATRLGKSLFRDISKKKKEIEIKIEQLQKAMDEGGLSTDNVED